MNWNFDWFNRKLSYLLRSRISDCLFRTYFKSQLVYCSAGIGRSGTYIALDYLLDQAKNEGIVDILKCAQLMRANRINMIQTWVSESESRP